MEALIKILVQHYGLPEWPVVGLLTLTTWVAGKFLLRQALRVASGDHLELSPEAKEIYRVLQSSSGWKLSKDTLTRDSLLVYPKGFAIYTSGDNITKLFNRKERRLLATQARLVAAELREEEVKRQAADLLVKLRAS